jgi:hypothetical protein
MRRTRTAAATVMVTAGLIGAVVAAPAQAGAPPPVTQRASDHIVVQCGDNPPLNYPAVPARNGQITAQDAFNSGGGAVALGETCEVIG